MLAGDGAADVAAASDGRFGPDPMDVLANWDQFTTWAATSSLPTPMLFDPATLGAPSPRPRQVFAVALNYRPHAAEAGYVPPEIPLLFTKFPSSIAGPFTVVKLPCGHVDWELELVAVMARDAYRVPAAQGWEAVAGVMVGQDLSERKLQLSGVPPQFSLAKSYPGFGPTGPVLVTLDELHDRDNVSLGCTLNGEIV